VGIAGIPGLLTGRPVDDLFDQPGEQGEGVEMISSVVITGDFFVFPQRAIYDLEARLKDCHRYRVPDVIRKFFTEKAPCIPHVYPEDFSTAIGLALEKADFARYGLSFSEANRIFTVNGTIGEILKKDINLLLLPYCAKLPDCRFRHKKGCAECERCDIGYAYNLGRGYGLIPESIQSFEDLMRTLLKYRSKEFQAFIGCCCEQFFIKHKDDFERTGMPGILVNVESGFDWADVKKVRFDCWFDGAGTGSFWVDGLYFGGRRYSSMQEDSGSQGSYGLREVVEIDEELYSDNECVLRAKALLSHLKEPAEYLTLRSTVIDYGDSPVLAGDKVHVTLPNENVDGDFRVLSVEYYVDAKTQSLEVILELGREQPLLADYLYALRSKTDSLSRHKIARLI